MRWRAIATTARHYPHTPRDANPEPENNLKRKEDGTENFNSPLDRRGDPALELGGREGVLSPSLPAEKSSREGLEPAAIKLATRGF